jgi:hypothetical protein
MSTKKLLERYRENSTARDIPISRKPVVTMRLPLAEYQNPSLTYGEIPPRPDS